jgi:hypothetical protein
MDGHPVLETRPEGREWKDIETGTGCDGQNCAAQFSQKRPVPRDVF